MIAANLLRSSNDSADEHSVIEHADGCAGFVVSSELSCHYDIAEATLWARWSPRSIPSFSVDLLRDLEGGSGLIEGYFFGKKPLRPIDYVILRSGNAAFNVGNDLGYLHTLIASHDRARLTDYARAAIRVQYRNFIAHGLPGATTVALLEGDALGSGLEYALSSDVVIAEKQVKAGFPEVLFGMSPGMGGMSFLVRRAGRIVANEMVRTGRHYTATELLDLGVVDQVVDTGQGMTAVRKLLRKREHQEAAQAAMNSVDRIVRPVSLEELYEAVRIWVDCALKLSPRNLDWMQRLYQHQLAVFARPPSISNPNEATGSPSKVAVAA